MRFIHLSDLHLGYYPKGVKVNPDVVSDGSYGLRRLITNRTLESFRRAVEYAVDNDIKLFLLAGDIFEDVDSSLLYSKKLGKYLEDLVRKRIHIVSIAGNHDAKVKVMKRASLTLFSSGLSNYIRYIDVYSTGDLQTLNDGYILNYDDLDISIVPLPYIYPDEGWRNVVRGYIERSVSNDLNRYKVLLAHIQVDRVRFSNMYGDEWEEMIPIDTITLTDIRHDLFDYVALGHIHLMQKVVIDKVYYSGSLNRLRFDEALDNKYFLDVELGNKLKINPVEVDPIKMYYIKLNLDGYDSVDSIMDNIASEVSNPSESLVKIRFTYINRDRYRRFRDKVVGSIEDYLFPSGVYGYKMEFKYIEPIYMGDASRRDVAIQDIRKEVRIEVALKQYINERFSDRGEVYRDRLYKLAMKYIEEVGRDAKA